VNASVSLAKELAGKPPGVATLLEEDPLRSAGAEIVELYQKHGVEPAIQKVHRADGL
jgi:hypothetical protein